jgi:23S rRNA (uracil1939-C5)-methyltransferase
MPRRPAPGPRSRAFPAAAGTLRLVPPKPGETVDLDVTTLAYGGQGVARLDGFVLFVRGAVPGDRVRARVTRRKKGHGEARTLEILSPSPDRVPFVCDHAADCGGCEWQTLSYEAQLEFKQQQVVESLSRLGHLEGYELEPIRGMDDPWRYRNKMEFSFGEAEDGAPLLGLHRRGSWQDIIETTDCMLASVRMNRARQAVAEASRDLGLRAFGREQHHGLLRHLVVREGLASGDLLLNLFASGRFPEEQELAERVAAACGCSSFGVTVNATPADAAVGDGPHMILGEPYLREQLAGIDLRVPATAFLQTNSRMCEVLYDTALRFADAEPSRPAVDLYCGIGSLSLPLARQARQVQAVEIQAEAIDAARENAALNDVANIDFYAHDVRPLLRFPPHPTLDAERADDADRPAVVMVDPPRAGLARKALQRAAALGADRFAYVSCNPTTLAANGGELAELGYRLERVAPVDMFPQTHHIETVALFRRQS